MASTRPLVIPVEKKGRFSEGYALRFLCFDPQTRMAYLSDKGAKVRFWKHQMKLYAVVPKLFEHKDSNGVVTASSSVTIDFRKDGFDANDLLTFVMHGVAHHKLDPNDANDRQQMERLPNLLQVTFEDTGSISAPVLGDAPAAAATSRKPGTAGGTTHYCEGDLIGKRSSAAVSMEDDYGFFGKDRTSWQLRCPYYNLWKEMMTLMRDTLIADGLRAPLHGNLPGYLDPRHGLRLATIPLWLERPFHLLTGAVVYCCIHGRMVGCSPQGAIGVCMRHCYVCITDQDVLFMSESGQAVRWMPIPMVQRTEYSLTGGGGPAAQPYVAFITHGGLADVLFLPCSAFTKSTASASMVSTMPACDTTEAIQHIISILEKLSATQGQPPAAHRGDVADADIDLDDLEVGGNESFDPDLVVADDVPNPSHGVASSHFTAVPVEPASLTVEQYCDGFAKAHGRAFRWQPMPGTHQETPSVLQAHVLAARLEVPQPERQPVTLRPEFLHFYFPDGDPSEAGGDYNASRTTTQSRGKSEPGSGGRENNNAVDELYEPAVPVKRGSKLLNVLAPDKRLFLM